MGTSTEITEVRRSRIREADRTCFPGSCDGPYVPPKGDVCFINDLAPELLCRIFKFSCTNDYGLILEEMAHELAISGSRYAKWARQIQGNADVEGRSGSEGKGIDNAGNSKRVTPYDSYPPFQIIISFVCRCWRDLALSTSSVWSDLDVYPIKGQSFKPESLVLERGRDMPIDVCVDCRFHEYSDNPRLHKYIGHIEPPSDAELTPLFRMLASNVHRWRTMLVNASNLYDLMYAFLKAASDPTILTAPQLETLELCHDGVATESISFPYPNMVEHLTLFGGSAPSLTRLVLWGVHVDWNQPWITSASNLRSLVLALHAQDVRPSWAQFATILRGASALRELSLHGSGPSGDPAEWFVGPMPGSFADLDAPVVLAGVTDLSITGTSQSHAIALFRKLCLPALKKLELALKSPNCSDLVQELAGPATSSSSSSALDKTASLLSSLETLELQAFSCFNGTAEIFYRELQNLTTLTVDMSRVRQEFLDILAMDRASPGRGDVFLPRLSFLYVDGASMAAVRNVVESRRDAGWPLNARLVNPTEIDMEFESSDEGEIEEEGSDDDDEWTDVDD